MNALRRFGPGRHLPRHRPSPHAATGEPGPGGDTAARPTPKRPHGPRGPVLMTTEKEDQAMDTLVEELRDQFPAVPFSTVLAVVTAAHHRFDGRPIRDFVPILVGRAVRDRLRENPQSA